MRCFVKEIRFHEGFDSVKIAKALQNITCSLEADATAFAPMPSNCTDKVFVKKILCLSCEELEGRQSL